MRHPSVLALATIGVVIATAVCGVILWLGFGLSPYGSFIFAAIIAPTDVVTVLDVFRRVKVPSKLATLLQTESAFNDAPAIAIFTIVLAAASLQTVNAMDAAFNFAYILGIGALIGLAVAFVGELLSSMFVDSVVETILAIVVVYGSFALAQGIGASDSSPYQSRASTTEATPCAAPWRNRSEKPSNASGR